MSQGTHKTRMEKEIIREHSDWIVVRAEQQWLQLALQGLKSSPSSLPHIRGRAVLPQNAVSQYMCDYGGGRIGVVQQKVRETRLYNKHRKTFIKLEYSINNKYTALS